ncbi:MAG: EAL domain-containing protein [Pseudomonas sp.]|nr:EAL domain-containing protein [Pseudomonas sp.]
MKSLHPVVSRCAAEVVTQLPVPMGLGMLRFERLNQDDWPLLYLDPACEQQLGLPAAQLCALLDSPYAQLMDEAHARLHASINQQLRHGGHYQVRYSLQTPLGPRYLLELGEVFEQYGLQQLRGYLLVDEQPPEPSLMPQASQSQPALAVFQRAIEQSASALLLLDRDGVVEYVNPSFTAISLYGIDEVRGRSLADLPALANLREQLFGQDSSLSDCNHWQGEFKTRRKNLDPYWAQLSIAKLYDEQQQLSHYLGTLTDISAAKREHTRLERLAYHDNLTGLGTRLTFIRQLEQRLSAGHDTPTCLLLVDIDNFKRINDSLGHTTGDKLLIGLALRLRNSLSPLGSLARLASNEFAVQLDGIDLSQGQRLAEQVLQTLSKPLFVDNQLINVSGSIGLACAPEHGRDPQTLLKHAGLALHKAKANGKQQLQVFNQGLNAEADDKLFIENNLRRALEQDELEVFYQPKLNLKTGQLQGVEALLRWHHPERGMINPAQFIGVAEETGQIIPIGKWVARQACALSKHLLALGLGECQVAINVSPKQFSDPNLVSAIAAILHEQQLPGRLLEIELTESLLLEATDSTREQLLGLKALGLTLAMDDFGTGYSSLSYLKKYPIDVLKIDRSFICDIPHDQDDMEITSAVIAMAHKLKLKVVAEGVETAEQLAFLRRQHCDIGQGYLFDRPLPVAQLIQRLQRYPGRNNNAGTARVTSE